jgi:hypothetical protein
MQSNRINTIAFTLLMLGVFTIACNRTIPPPAPLPVEEFPAAFGKAFSKANPELKDLAGEIVSLVQTQDFAKAFFALQNMSAKPSLTKDQTTLIGRGSLTINSLLQAASDKGDAKAAEAVKFYHDTK